MPIWSIIVLTTPKRHKTSFPKIIAELTWQAPAGVEVIGLYDNKSQGLGEKRNSAVAASTGRYISFVDDDDDVSPKYISSVLAARRRNREVEAVFFDLILKDLDHNRKVYCTYSPGLACDSITQLLDDGTELRKLLVPHTAVWRRDFFERIEFGNEMPEDMLWSRKSNAKLKKWSHIKTPLYFYNLKPSESEWERPDLEDKPSHEKLSEVMANGNTFSF